MPGSSSATSKTAAKSQLADEPERVQVHDFTSDWGDRGDLGSEVRSDANNELAESPKLAHQLFVNDGKGNFSRVKNAFPANKSNVGAVVANDFDGDGDLDLFIGGHSKPFFYGVSPESYLYLNDGRGIFSEAKWNDAKDSNKPGMITGAVMADVIGDAKKEMVVVGEWMSPKVFEYKDKHFNEVKTNLGSLDGWWQTVAASDLDGDGRCDLVLGNIGENFYLKPDSVHPAKLWLNYFGIDGSIQQFITRTVDGRDVPVFMKRNMEDQFLYLKKENLEHVSYATKSAEELFGKELTQKAIKKEFNFCSTVIAWNEGGGKFKIEKLPQPIQFSSVNAIACLDANGDGKLDVVTGGNMFHFTPQFGRLDSNFGSVLINKGGRQFQLLSTKEAGIQLQGQVRDIKSISNGDKKSLLFLRNGDSPVLFKSNTGKK